MARLPRKASSSMIYHVMFRGINKQDIFESDEDYERILNILLLLKKEMQFEIYAYCLMTNHVHLLIKEKSYLDISIIIKRLLIRYVGWYNKKYGRVGKLINDRYASVPVKEDIYFFNVIRYIHQNPVKIGGTLNYKWSSFNEYIKNCSQGILDKQFVFSMINKCEFIKFNNEEEKESFEPNEKLIPSDSDVRNYIWDRYGIEPLKIVLLEKNDKVQIVYELRKKYSIRQICRVTGVPRATVERTNLHDSTKKQTKQKRPQ